MIVGEVLWDRVKIGDMEFLIGLREMGEEKVVIGFLGRDLDLMWELRIRGC